MVGLHSFSWLKTAFPLRNISTTSCLHRLEAQVPRNIAFVNKLQETNTLQISVAVDDGERWRRVGFLRPLSCTVEHSFLRMKQKIQREITTTDDIQLALIDPKDANAQYALETWESLLPALPSLCLQINGSSYKIAYNYPTIKRIDLPKATPVGLDVFPTTIDFAGNIEDCHFQWLRKYVKGRKWLELNNQTQIYRCTNGDLGAMLKLTCSTQYKGVQTSFVESNVSYCMEPIDSPIVDKRLKHAGKQLNDPEFRVVSYNILADFYASTKYSKEELFSYCEEKYLDRAYREPLLQKEIFGYNSDIYCLQEMDKGFFLAIERSLQYRSLHAVFEPKGATKEGLATLYNTQKFDLVADYTMIYRDALVLEHLVDFLDTVRTNVTFMDKFMKLHNFVQVLHLKSRTDETKQLLVVNTHLYSQPGAESIRFLQMVCAIKHIEHLQKTIKCNQNDIDLAIIMCGDLNAAPHIHINTFALNGMLAEELRPFENDLYMLKSPDYTHSLKLSSAYALNGITMYTPYYVGTLDYMYFSPHSLFLKKVVPMPDEHLLAEQKGLPSKHLGSDHLALISDFRWVNKCKDTQPSVR